MTLVNFKERLNTIYKILSLSEKERKVVDKNLFLALWVNFLTAVAGTPKNVKMLASLLDENITSEEEFNMAVTKTRKMYNDTDTNLETLFTKAQNETLMNYARELKESFSPEEYSKIIKVAR